LAIAKRRGVRQSSGALDLRALAKGVPAWAEYLRAAQAAAYAAVEKMHFDGAHFRRDIAAKAMK